MSTGSVGLPKNVLQQSISSDANIMEIHTDFKELLELFDKEKVKYALVGFKTVFGNNWKSWARDIMKILIVIILCLMVQIVGCSRCCYPGESLWQERRMEDDRRIYGDPYKSYPKIVMAVMNDIR